MLIRPLALVALAILSLAPVAAAQDAALYLPIAAHYVAPTPYIVPSPSPEPTPMATPTFTLRDGYYHSGFDPQDEGWIHFRVAENGKAVWGSGFIADGGKDAICHATASAFDYIAPIEAGRFQFWDRAAVDRLEPPARLECAAISSESALCEATPRFVNTMLRCTHFSLTVRWQRP